MTDTLRDIRQSCLHLSGPCVSHRGRREGGTAKGLARDVPRRWGANRGAARPTSPPPDAPRPVLLQGGPWPARVRQRAGAVRGAGGREARSCRGGETAAAGAAEPHGWAGSSSAAAASVQLHPEGRFDEQEPAGQGAVARWERSRCGAGGRAEGVAAILSRYQHTLNCKVQIKSEFVIILSFCLPRHQHAVNCKVQIKSDFVIICSFFSRE